MLCQGINLLWVGPHLVNGTGQNNGAMGPSRFASKLSGYPNPSFSQLNQGYLHCQLSPLQHMSCWTCLQYKPVATIIVHVAQTMLKLHTIFKQGEVLWFLNPWSTHQHHLAHLPAVPPSHLQPVGDRGRGAPTNEPTLGSLTKTRRHTFTMVVAGSFLRENDKCCFKTPKNPITFTGKEKMTKKYIASYAWCIFWDFFPSMMS